MPKISVIVPNYNHARYLRQRIDSILNQTFQDFELIILDDFSYDNSREIIDDYKNRFPSITTYYNESNSGSAFKQWDSGVSKAKGEFIWIAESDDYAEPEFLEKAASVLNSNSQTGLVYCNSKIFDEGKNIHYLASNRKPESGNNIWLTDYFNNGRNEISEHLFRHNTINNVSGVLFRKSNYLDAGSADHSFKYCGDWFLYIRILLISDIGYLSLPLNNLRLHSGSTFKKYFTNNTFLLEVIKIFLFIRLNIELTTWKKLKMLRVLMGIGRRMLLHGIAPDFKTIARIHSEYNRHNRPMKKHN